ncbi:hypothetical protein ACIQU6_30860 [Streptomyces sp. NPDC090442]|uniref:hypothetical protein n=1 Tax=Streptomyces sp. NPDC090442 TaxID=3365962 RepID=UPI0037F8B0E7
MTRPPAPLPVLRRGALVLTAAAAAVALSACSSSSSGDDAAHPGPTPSRPAATGTGPYPEPPGTAVSPMPSGKEGMPHGGIPSPGDVDQGDATAVAHAAITAMWTVDTTIDTTMQDAITRAVKARWCTPAYGRQLAEHQPHTGPGAAWIQWAQHRAYTTVSIKATDDAGRPADTATTAYRQMSITITPHGRDTWTGQPETHAAYAVLTRAAAGQPWRISNTVTQ